jgi:elongator complex protein 3
VKLDYTNHLEELLPLLQELEAHLGSSPKKVQQIIRKYKRPEGVLWSKDDLIAAYRHLAGTNGLAGQQEAMFKMLRKRPIRTQSGVAPITVLTKPFPCPGKCIFCPNDIRMPKSYLADEPGAQRAERNFFDPYLQTYNRLLALHLNGHTVDKAELIILGGTWSFYPESYQIWFVKECFRALNDFQVADGREAVLAHYRQMEHDLAAAAHHAPSDQPEKNKAELAPFAIDGGELIESYNQVISELYVAPERLGGFDRYQAATWEELFAQHERNEAADSRCVGLVVETRPDNISPAEVLRIRKLGCTKTQIGLQSLQDLVLAKNKRGHDVAASRKAIGLLRQAGLKIHAHWMANLYGSSVAADISDFDTLFSDPDFCPDELKIYPCSLIGSAELMQYFKSGKWRPYTREELHDVLIHCLQATPQYCRLTRIIRDIPSTDIVEGNKLTNFRQIAEQSLESVGKRSNDIRAREIRGHEFAVSEIYFEEVRYTTSVADEVFLQCLVPVTESSGERVEKILGFVRLSLPTVDAFIPELDHSAIIREVHVYGPAQALGKRSSGKAQHTGLGSQLIARAQALARTAGFSKLAVISAIGTREYYRKLGFVDGELYQHFSLD